MADRLTATAVARAVGRATRSSEGGSSTTLVVARPSPAPTNPFAKNTEGIVEREGEAALLQKVDQVGREGRAARDRCWWLQSWRGRFRRGWLPEWECLRHMFPTTTIERQRKRKLQDFLMHCWFVGEPEETTEVPVDVGNITKEWYENFVDGKRWKWIDPEGKQVLKKFTFWDTRRKHGDDHAVQVSAIIVGNNNSVD